MDVGDLDSLKEKESLVRDLGIEYVETEPGRVVMRMPVDRRHHQPLGFLHGGASVVLAETVATTGAWLNCPEGKVAFGSEINASHLRPKREGMLTAVGMPVQVGRTNQVWEVEIRDEEGKPVCVSRCRLAVVDAR
ncbi:MAG TPA: hotdog fold thioesterase [Rubrobacteraceae bacterium]|nr:hotdog fold thioesterase [Rubrobacteraceae bacterium]